MDSKRDYNIRWLIFYTTFFRMIGCANAGWNYEGY